jgi:hypothetical protein
MGGRIGYYGCPIGVWVADAASPTCWFLRSDLAQMLDLDANIGSVHSSYRLLCSPRDRTEPKCSLRIERLCATLAGLRPLYPFVRSRSCNATVSHRAQDIALGDVVVVGIWLYRAKCGLNACNCASNVSAARTKPATLGLQMGLKSTPMPCSDSPYGARDCA